MINRNSGIFIPCVFIHLQCPFSQMNQTSFVKIRQVEAIEGLLQPTLYLSGRVEAVVGVL